MGVTGSIGGYRVLSPGKLNNISDRCGSVLPGRPGAGGAFTPAYPSRVIASPNVPDCSLCYFRHMDKRITRYGSLKAMKSDEYRAWQGLPGSERIRAVMDLNLDLYAMKGQAADAPRLQRTVIRFQRRAG